MFLQVMEPIQGVSLHTHRFDQNEAAFSISIVKFASSSEPDQQFLLVGTAKVNCRVFFIYVSYILVLYTIFILYIILFLYYSYII